MLRTADSTKFSEFGGAYSLLKNLDLLLSYWLGIDERLGSTAIRTPCFGEYDDVILGDSILEKIGFSSSFRSSRGRGRKPANKPLQEPSTC